MDDKAFNNIIKIFISASKRKSNIINSREGVYQPKIYRTLSDNVESKHRDTFKGIVAATRFGKISTNIPTFTALEIENIEKNLSALQTSTSKVEISNFIFALQFEFYQLDLYNEQVEFLQNNPGIMKARLRIIAKIAGTKTEAIPEPSLKKHKAEIASALSDAKESFSKHSVIVRSDYDKQTATELKSIKQDIQTQVSAAVEALKTGATLTEAYALWNDKEHHHRENFKKGIFLFLGAVGITIALVSAAWPDISTFITTDTEKLANLISRTIITSLPISLLIWILRAILRWANMNLSLAEDAAQRRVLANTYVNLLATEKEHMPEERAIMLNAIFRPLPGVKDMDVEPTTIVDIVKAARGK